MTSLTNEDKCFVLEILDHDDRLVEDHVVILKLSTVVWGVHDPSFRFFLAQTASKCLPIQSVIGFTSVEVAGGRGGGGGGGFVNVDVCQLQCIKEYMN